MKGKRKKTAEMKAKNRKRHEKKDKLCSFCGAKVGMGGLVIAPDVFACSECMHNVNDFLAEVEGKGVYGYKTTDGKTGIFTIEAL